MIPLLFALLGAAGVYLLYSFFFLGQRQLFGSASRSMKVSRRTQIEEWLIQAGIGRQYQGRFVGTILALFALGCIGGWMAFGGVLGPLVLGIFVSTFALSSYRAKRERARSEAAEAWPRMIEEVRLLCGSLGRPIPQALLEVGRNAPPEMASAFAEATREWKISTDFERCVAVLKAGLVDPTADATCETLLIAHRLGGADIDKRLAALAEDRHADLNGRKDAKAKQAGVRFARRFVLVVPAGMALAGMSIGNGKAAYETFAGQVGVTLALVTLAACWYWAGRLIRLPQEERVFRV